MANRFLGVLGALLWGWGCAGAQNVAGIINPAQGAAVQRGGMGQVQAFQASDAMPLRALLSDWGGAFHPLAESVAWGVAQIRTGFTYEGWEVEGVWRAQALVRASRDTWTLARQYQRKEAFDTNYTYMLDYQLSGFEADGIRLGQSSAPRPLGAGSIRWGAGLSLLRGRRLKLESAQGQAVTLAAHDVDLRIAHAIGGTEFDTQDATQFNPFVLAPGGVSGQGYALDIGLEWRSPAGAVVGFAINDALGEIQWNNVPSRVAATASAAKVYDAQGYVTLLHAVTPRSQYGSVRQTLPLRWSVTLEYPVSSRASVVGAWSQVEQFAMPEIGVRIRSDSAGVWRLDYDTRFQTWGLGVEKGGWNAGLRTQNLDLSQSTGYGVNLGFAAHF